MIDDVLNDMAMPDESDGPIFNKNLPQNERYYLITVPRTTDGLKKIAMLKEIYKNVGTIKLYGRHSDRRAFKGDKYRPGGGGHYNEIPWSQGEWIAVYLTKKSA